MKSFAIFIIGSLTSTLILLAAFANASVKLPPDYQHIGPGGFIDSTHQLMTYEQICNGYYIIDTSNKNKTKYIGFGDLADKYTYEEVPFTLTATSTTP